MPINEQTANAHLSFQKRKNIDLKRCNDNSSSCIKKSKLKDSLNAKSINCLSDSISHKSNYHPQHLQLPLKLKLSNEVSENCDKNRKIEKKMNNDEDMSSIPLNLCIKKPEKVSESSNANSNHEKTHTKVNVPQVNSTINSCHYSLINQSKKRGRKPKSILASSNPTIAHSSPFIDIKPRKRGRPPTLSPPPSHSSHLQQTALSIANKLHFSSLSGAFQNQYPFALLNTPLQPGWPTLSSTGQLIFPDKINGNQSFVDDKKNKIRENKVDSSVSGNSDINESIDSYSESNNEDDDSQSDSYSQSSEIRFSDKKLQDEIRLPHKYG